MIRFRIDDGDATILTEWVDELLGDLHQQTAAQRVAELRRDYPKSAISIERSSVIPRKKQTVVRFKLVEGDTTMYSIPFPIAEKDAQLAKLQAQYPAADITEEVREL